MDEVKQQLELLRFQLRQAQASGDKLRRNQNLSASFCFSFHGLKFRVPLRPSFIGRRPYPLLFHLLVVEVPWGFLGGGLSVSWRRIANWRKILPRKDDIVLTPDMGLPLQKEVRFGACNFHEASGCTQDVSSHTLSLLVHKRFSHVIFCVLVRILFPANVCVNLFGCA